MAYDSTQDTLEHIQKVRMNLDLMMLNLRHRAQVHDRSKLVDPEKSAFDEITPLLKETTYGTERYRELLREQKPAIHHHYSVNSHHPEYYSNGLSGMSLFDLIEMLADWKAASERHLDGNLSRSFEVNKDRETMTPQLFSVLWNTAKEMGWL